ncbi:MAG: SIS domain-containing protein [Flavobacteriales bacterium]|nr:SIS domain-containing protein [Flavobacteriales bacterium]
MQISTYNKFYSEYFNGEGFQDTFSKSMQLLQNRKRIFFVGNGGSNSICSHMMEDYAKIGRFQSFTFSDPAFITCYANDYGYDNAMKEWLAIYFEKGDLLIAISSSGNSANILNAVDKANEKGGEVITLSGFKSDNKLRQKGNVNYYLDIENYGVVECFHQVILHAMLDEYAQK